MSTKNITIVIEDETGINHCYIAEIDSEYKCYAIITLDNYHKNVTFIYDSKSFKLSDVEPCSIDSNTAYIYKKYVKTIRIDDVFVKMYITFSRYPHDGNDTFIIKTCGK